MHYVSREPDVSALTLHREDGLGNEHLQRSFAAPILSPEGLICEDQDGVLKVSVEVPTEMTAIRYVDVMLAEKAAEQASK